MTKLLIKKLHPKAKLPEKAHQTDAGFDLFSIEQKEIPAGETRLVKTGISLQLPASTEAQIRPRSGLALKHSITVLNSPGTIDEEYRGEIGVILINHGKETYIVEEHMKIAQMVIKPVLHVDIEEATGDLTDSDRGSGGFGSSGY
ncbi:dUTP diphosphatase [Planococcus shenhongbingii]|uniref:dUTP diphosphatase n=1 Tax=Planococcus shenhongbingii TaxID=3058398 RepID=UPI003F540BE2